MHSLAVLLPPAVLAALPAGGQEGDDAQAVVGCGLTRLLRLLRLCLQGGTFSLQDVDSEEQYPRGHFAGCVSEIMVVGKGVARN